MATIDDIMQPVRIESPQEKPVLRKPTLTVPVNGGNGGGGGNFGVSVTSMVKPETLDVEGKIKPTATLSYADMYKRLNTYTPPTAEELEAERRKQKRDMTLASIGNGLNAFHQAYANARGVKPIAENVSLTGKVRDRYEKLKKERDALSREYANGLLRAMQMDQEQGNWREKLDYQKEHDQRDSDYKKGRDEANDAFRDKQFDRQGEQWQKEHEMRKEQNDKQNALAWAAHNLAVQTRKDNKELGQQRIAALGARGVRGKQLAFSDGNGNNHVIYENVWKGSMEQVYDAIAADFKAQRKKNEEIRKNDPKAVVPDVPRGLPKKASAQQKDDYVKQHWHKSAVGRQMMQTLAGIDPANMTSSAGNYDQYEVKNDDYSQYLVK